MSITQQMHDIFERTEDLRIRYEAVRNLILVEEPSLILLGKYHTAKEAFTKAYDDLDIFTTVMNNGFSIELLHNIGPEQWEIAAWDREMFCLLYQKTVAVDWRDQMWYVSTVTGDGSLLHEQRVADFVSAIETAVGRMVRIHARNIANNK